MYKRSVVKTLVHRVLKYSPFWKAFDSESKRICQTLVYNDYFLYIVDSIIITQLDDKINPRETQEDVYKEIKFNVNLDKLASFKNARRYLYMFLKEHVKLIEADTTVKLCGYFKPFKMECYFSKRSKPDTLKTACFAQRRSHLQGRKYTSSVFKTFRSFLSQASHYFPLNMGIKVLGWTHLDLFKTYTDSFLIFLFILTIIA